MPIQHGQIKRVRGLSEQVQSPIFATCVGLVLQAAEEHEEAGEAEGGRSFTGAIGGLLKRAFRR